MNNLEAKVKAVNEANAEAIRLHGVMIGRFAPHVGEKIVKADGSLLKKFSEFDPVSVGFRVTRTPGTNTIGWVVQRGVVGERTWIYHESFFTIGYVENGVLTKLNETPPDCRTDYTVEWVVAARLELERAEQARREAECAICHFGRYDG